MGASIPLMAVEVRTEIVIARPLAVVAAYAGDPTNAPEWYANISSVEWHTPPPVQAMSRANRKDLARLKTVLESRQA